jgi:hypothetical protein
MGSFPMPGHGFDDFLESDDTLRVYDGGVLIFSSAEDRLLPWLEYIKHLAPSHQQVVALDKIMGNAAALLSVKAGCREVASPLGSQVAVATLESYGIRHYLAEVVPYIQRPDGRGLCPMEALSLGKGPEDFYRAMVKALAPE